MIGGRYFESMNEDRDPESWDAGGLENYRKYATKAAKDLAYPDKVIYDIKAAKSESDIARIMTTARNRQFKK